MRFRFIFTFFLFVLAFFLILSRLFYWQIVKADELSALGQSQYGQVIRSEPKRGEIKTSDNYPLVSNKIVYLVYANPKQIKEKEKVITLLSSALKVDEASVSASLSLDKFWVPIKSNVDEKTRQELEKLNIPGIGFEENYVRYYPEASMAAQIVGFVGKDEMGDNKGYFGIEGEYDRQLKGKKGQTIEIRDAFGRPILSKVNENTNAVDGRSVILNIDRAIQFILEEKLKDGIEKYGAEAGMAAVMDPKTGNIIAMSSFPSFDPRSFQDFDYSLYKNPFISNLYEPGSTFKPLIMAAAIDSKIVKPDTKCPICAGPVSIGGYQIKTWNDQYFKNTTMTEIIQHSDNTGMVYVAQSLGLDKILNYFDKYGIGNSTGIDLQGEVSQNIKSKESWYPIDVATAGFGQGISLTPIELLDAFSSIANSGVRMEPHVVSEIENQDGDTIKIKPKSLGRVISSATAKIMTEMLVNAVDNGEAKWAKPKGYRIAGKTGTAQIPIAGHYDPNKTIASFIGFAPAENPRFVMLVIIDKPTTSIYGAETAAPVFFGIAKDILAYYNIAPSEE